jgi:hypothetical protein
MSEIVRLERRDADLYVAAEWDGDTEGTEIVGPQRVVIEAADVTATVLRHADRRINDMTGEFNKMLYVGGYRLMVRHYVQDQLAELPTSGDAYHQGLLDLLDDVATRTEGRLDARQVLADAMRVPEACLPAGGPAAPRPLI